MITLVSVLKSVDKVFLKMFLKVVFLCRCKFVLSIASRNYLLYLKGLLFSSLPLDSVFYPKIFPL